MPEQIATSESLAHLARPSRPRHRWLLWLLVLLSIPPALAGITLALFAASAASRERAAVAEADRTDPSWRSADIEAARPAVPDADNAALLVRDAQAAIALRGGYPPPVPRPAPTGVAKPARGRIDLLPSNVALGPAHLDTLAEDLESFGPPLAQARKLAGMRRGRFPRPTLAPTNWTLPPHLDAVRSVADMLANDALLRAEQGDVDGAILDCRAMLGAAASIGDEPGMEAALARRNCLERACIAIQRALAQGTATDDLLARLDADLAAELAVDRLRPALRGERASSHEFLGRLASGSLTPAGIGMTPAGSLGGWGLKGPHIRAWFRNGQGFALERMNEAIAIAEQPASRQRALWAAWNDQLMGRMRGNPLTLVLEAPGRVIRSAWNAADTFLVVRAKAESARVAIALERYRLAHGRWPDDPLAPLLPVDPFADAPLNIRRFDGGWAIYSVGPNLTDDGGKLDATPTTRPTDVGFRLFDPEARRRPPAPASP